MATFSTGSMKQVKSLASYGLGLVWLTLVTKNLWAVTETPPACRAFARALSSAGYPINVTHEGNFFSW